MQVVDVEVNDIEIIRALEEFIEHYKVVRELIDAIWTQT